MTNFYRRGANLERKAVTEHEKKGAIITARFASSKCKGKIKADVFALYEDRVVLEQYKHGKGSFKKDQEEFYKPVLPETVKVERKFIVKGVR